MSHIITIEKELYPIVIVKTTSSNFTLTEVDDYLQMMTKFYAENQGKKVVVIYDISVLKATGAKARIKIGEWLGEKRDLINNAVAGVCYVQKNIFHKMLLQGIFAVNKPVWKHKVVKNVAEGIDWGKKILNL
jgi:hypothetical protein